MTQVVVNEASNLLEFLEAWLDPQHERNRVEVAALTTADGRVTELHDPAPGRGPLVTRYHPRFAELLEPGVRELVLRLVRTWNVVTYSSCEGHRLPDGRIMPWCIGVLDLGGVAPRIFECLWQACRARNIPDERVGLQVEPGTLHSDAAAIPVIDLRIHPTAGATWAEYVAVREATTKVLSRAERALAEELGRSR